VRLNGAPWVSGTPISASGSYVIDVIATDLAGNQASSAVHFTLDLDPPTLAFVSPDPGTIVSVATVDVAGQTEALAQVHLGTGVFAVDVKADADGRFEVAAVPLQAGSNAILAHATDQAGNNGVDAQLDVVYQPPVAAVTGQIGSLASPLQQGEPIDAPYELDNTGAVALAGLPLRFELRTAGGGDPLLSDEFTVDLPLAGVLDGMRQLPASALAAGNYVLSLLADLPDDAQGWFVLDAKSLVLVPARCRHGDVIFTDGFDGVGVQRDGLIFCDGFEVASSGAVALAARAPWLDTTVWLAAVGAKPVRAHAIGSFLRAKVAQGPRVPPTLPRRAFAVSAAASAAHHSLERNVRPYANTLPSALAMSGNANGDFRKELH
jgi:hypothetical protein